jgi:hypothetical protein
LLSTTYANCAKISSRYIASPLCLRRTGAGACAAGAEADPQDIAQLEALAKSEAALQFPPLTIGSAFWSVPSNRNLQFEKCNRPVRPVVASPHHMQDRVMIELRCPDPKPWHLYVPVMIVGTSPVAVAVHAIVPAPCSRPAICASRNTMFRNCRLGFLDDPAIAVGLTASRPIAGGAYLTNQLLVAPKPCRGVKR